MAIFDVPLSELQQRTSMKWRRFGADILPAWVAEMDCRPAPAVRDALFEAIETGDTGYPEGDVYQRAYADFAARRWNWQFDPADAVIVPDVMQGAARVAELLTAPDSHIVVNNPVYNCFYGYLPWVGRNVLEVPLTADHELDLDALEDAFAGRLGPKPQGYLLCNPHNPTGTQFTAAELGRVAELADTYDVTVISDEIHAPLMAADSGFVPYLSLPGTENAVTVTSASKAWNLAGLKAALAIGGSRSAEALRTLPDEVTHSASHLGLISHAVALTKAEDWLDQVIGEIESNRQLLFRLLAERAPQLRYRPGPATYLAWVDCSALGVTNPAAVFRTRGKVALSPGAIFGSGADQHVRVNVATSPEILTEVVDRMVRAIE
ncbi:MalY/PatB family protein [Naumannella halotolerans]|uniref:MalY/PatB family protein n=1 Tax=Naumannella halotolerans TaxID=993414 RepID=UPI00370D0D31